MADLSSQPSPLDSSLNPDRENGATWADAARQLRELREEQRRTWGELDSSTLGRYLADEVDAAERAQVEAEMAAHPELARLTDLVRDVLADFQPGEVAVPVVPAPVVLAPELAQEGTPGIVAFAPRKRKLSFFARHRHELALAAAACFLFVIGWHMFQFAVPPGDDLTAGNIGLAQPLIGEVLPNNVVAVASLKPLEQLDRRLAEEQAAAPGKTPDVLPFDTAYRQLAEKDGGLGNSARFAQSLDNLGNSLKDQGYLARAEQNFQQSWAIRSQKCGQNDPETVRTARDLASVYQLALNSPYGDIAGGGYGTVRGGFVPSSENPPPTANFTPAPPTGPYSGNPYAGNPYTGTGPAFSGVSMAAKVGDRDANRSRELREVQLKIAAQPAEKVRESVVPVMAQALRHALNREERLSLIQALGRLGPAARDATPLLLERLATADTDAEKLAVVRALGQVGAGIPKVSNALSEVALQQPQFGYDAGRSLLALGPDGRRAVEDLAREEPILRKQILDLPRYEKAEVAKKLEDRLQTIDQIKKLAAEPMFRTGLLDTACVFTPHTLLVANHHIDRMSQEPARQVFIETCRRQADARETVAERARLLGTQGLYVLIATEPGTIQLHVGEPLRQAGFTETKERALNEALKKLATTKKYDEMPPLILAALPKASPIQPAGNP
jgi:hypothetical protein